MTEIKTPCCLDGLSSSLNFEQEKKKVRGHPSVQGMDGLTRSVVWTLDKKCAELAGKGTLVYCVLLLGYSVFRLLFVLRWRVESIHPPVCQCVRACVFHGVSVFV